MRRSQFEVSGFVLLISLWYHALMDDAAIVHAPCSVLNKVCAEDSLPALLVNSTVTEFLDVSEGRLGRISGSASVVSLTQSVVLCSRAFSSTLLRCFQLILLDLFILWWDSLFLWGVAWCYSGSSHYPPSCI